MRRQDRRLDRSLVDVASRRWTAATVAMRGLRGRPLLLNFWATWCGPCATEMPLLDRSRRTPPARVGMFWRWRSTTQSRCGRFIAERPLRLPVALAARGPRAVARSSATRWARCRSASPSTPSGTARAAARRLDAAAGVAGKLRLRRSRARTSRSSRIVRQLAEKSLTAAWRGLAETPQDSAQHDPGVHDDGPSQAEDADRPRLGVEHLRTRDHRSRRQGSHRQDADPRRVDAQPRRPVAARWSPPPAARRRRRRPRPRRRRPGHVVKSPMVGTFYRSPARAPSRSSRSARVKEGDPICIIEAMKIMNEIEADAAGTIKRDPVRERPGRRVRPAALRHRMSATSSRCRRDAGRPPR